MEKVTIKKLVYDELKKNILSLNLEPGIAMSTQEIAQKLNVSRTPVREAFLQLQEEGLVEMIPQRETIVSQISFSRIAEEKFIRESLELGAIDRFIRIKNDKEVFLNTMEDMIREQRECASRGDHVGFIQVDDKFHKILFEATGQQIAWSVIARNSGHYNRFRILFVQLNGVQEDSILQHDKILQLLKEGNVLESAKALKNHIQRINMEEIEALLTSIYPDYFQSREDQGGAIRIGTL